MKAKTKILRAIPIAIAGLLVLAVLALSQEGAPEIRKNVVYHQVGGEALKLDLIEPISGNGPFPLIIWIHGGAWEIGDRKDNHKGMMGFAKLGYAGASVQYRFAPKCKFPAQLDDVRAALAFLRAHAREYNIDPHRIGVCGGSAGGQLALLLGLAQSDENGQANAIRAVVNFYGPTDFHSFTVPEQGEALFRKGFGKNLNGILEDFLGTSDRNAAIMAEASPVTYVRADSPPVLTIHGAADVIVPITQAELLHAALKKSGVTEKLMVIEKGGHGLEDWPDEKRNPAFVAMLEFLDAHVKRAGITGEQLPAAAVSEKRPTGQRSFRMGFTGFVHDTTPEAVAASRKFVRENGDILAHHIEGVPWAEALGELPFPKAMLEEWEGKKSATPPGGKVYLAISPGRGDLQLAEKALALPQELKEKAYDDPLVKKAFLRYCQRSIEFFKPDYLGIGIEVNEIYSASPGKWKAYVELHKYVYEQLKKEHKDLPIFASFTLHNMFKRRGRMLTKFQTLIPYNDLLAVSYYPFFVDDKDRLAALAWLTESFDSFQKPYAMVETNDAAERLSFRWAAGQPLITIEGTPARQLGYYEKLLPLAQTRRFAFVVSFVHQDYDALWEKIKTGSPEFFVAWRDCGLLDEKGKTRPAYQVWKNYFEMPFQSAK